MRFKLLLLTLFMSFSIPQDSTNVVCDGVCISHEDMQKLAQKIEILQNDISIYRQIMEQDSITIANQDSLVWVLNQKYEHIWSAIGEEEEILIQDLQIMSGDIIAEDSFVDSDEEGNEMYGYILLLPKGVGDNWYMLELYFHEYGEDDAIEIEFRQTEEPEWRGVPSDKYMKGLWLYDKEKPLENILLNWLDINPLEVK